MIIIDATNLIVGRLASYAAKSALQGRQVNIVNSEKAVISGTKKDVFDKYLNRRQRGTPAKGPFLSRLPDRILRRAVRGMLPYKKPRGREAYKRVMCYIGVPKEFENKKIISIEDANVAKLPNLKYINLLTLSKRLGAKLE